MLANRWEELNVERVPHLSIRKAVELLAEKPEEPEPSPELEAPEVTPHEPMPAELFGIPVWFDGGEDEPSTPQQPIPVRKEAVGERPVVMAHVGYSSASDGPPRAGVT